MTDLPVTMQQAGSALSAEAPPALPKGASADEARAAARDFEAFFVTQMLEQMFKDISTDGPFGGGYGEGVYRSFLLKEYGRVIADSGGVGIADMVSRELLRLQEDS